MLRSNTSLRTALLACFLSLTFAASVSLKGNFIIEDNNHENEDPRTVIYHRSSAPINSAWNHEARSTSNTLTRFDIALKLRNTDALIEKLYAVSEPGSAEYGQHMTKDQILDMIAPTEDVPNEVIAWLRSESQKSSGEEVAFLQVANKRDAISVVASCGFVERLFKTEMHSFSNSKTGEKVEKHLGSLSIPTSLAGYVELVTGITEFAPKNLLKKSKEQLPNDFSDFDAPARDNLCNTAFTLKNLYNIPQDLVVTQPGATLSAFAQGYRAGFGEADLELYLTSNGQPRNTVNCILAHKELYSPNVTDFESPMDIQLEAGIASGAKTCYWIMPPRGGWMYEFSQVVFETTDAPKVISISYAWYENQQCDNQSIYFVSNCTALDIPNSNVYVSRLNIEWAKLGLLGITILAASGDDGTAGNHGSPDFCKTLEPVYPAASPYVLSVGATAVLPSNSLRKVSMDAAPPICTTPSFACNCSTSILESAANRTNAATFDTGGGFSRWSSLPLYQANAVEAYVKSGVQLPDKTLWDQTKRGYPDVSAVGSRICMMYYKRCLQNGGTSAATPILAGMITLLNNDRLAANKTTLGFVNPMIYKMFGSNSSKYFNNYFPDGNNGGECGLAHGFNAKAGQWTPLTGVGTPNFGAIREFVAQLP